MKHIIKRGKLRKLLGNALLPLWLKFYDYGDKMMWSKDNAIVMIKKMTSFTNMITLTKYIKPLPFWLMSWI